MIIGNIHHLKEFDYLSDSVRVCFDYAAAHDLSALEPGSYPIDGDNLFVNINAYETTQAENRVWEAHRSYLDLHLMLHGKEQIDFNFIANMDQHDFVEKDDFLPMDGEPNGHIILADGDFLICYPNDAHRTAIAVNGPEKIKKAIFKIKIQ